MLSALKKAVTIRKDIMSLYDSVSVRWAEQSMHVPPPRLINGSGTLFVIKT